MSRSPSLSTRLAIVVIVLAGCHQSDRLDISGRFNDLPSHVDIQRQTALERVARSQLAAVVEIRALLVEPSREADESLADDQVLYYSLGSGVIVGNDGLVLTNAHVIDGASRIHVTLQNGGVLQVRAFVTDPRLDLALLWIDSPLENAIQPIVHDGPKGTAIVAVSGVGSDSERFAVGVVTRPLTSLQHELDPETRRDYGHLLECTAEIRAGYSGGPVFDEEGNWIGISVAAAEHRRSKRTLGYVIPMTLATRLAIRSLTYELDDLIRMRVRVGPPKNVSLLIVDAQ